MLKRRQRAPLTLYGLNKCLTHFRSQKNSSFVWYNAQEFGSVESNGLVKLWLYGQVSSDEDERDHAKERSLFKVFTDSIISIIF